MSERTPSATGGRNAGASGESAPKKRGPKPGWKKKLKEQEQAARSELTSFLPAVDEQFIPEAPPPAVRSVDRLTFEATPSGAHAEDLSLDETVERLMALRDFLALGTKARIVVVAVHDVSPSERPHETEWVNGSKSIPEEIRKVVSARNLIDVIYSVGHEGFRVISVGPGKDFAFPAGQIPWGGGTNASPWLDGVRRAIATYTAHLKKLGIGVREKVILVCSDFCFGDDFRQALARFKEWAAQEKLVTVIPAVFGNASLPTAAQFALGGAEVVDLKKVSFAHLFRALSQSVVNVSQKEPTPDSLGREMTKAIGSGAHGRDQANRG